jgi:signal transduction histidine kinase
LLQLFNHFERLDIKRYILSGFLFAAFLFTLEVTLEIRNPFLLFSISIPFVVVAIAVWGMAYGTMLSAVAGTVTSFAIYLGHSPFHQESSFDNTVNFNLFILAYVSTVLTMGVLFEERRQAEKRLQRKVEKAVRENREQQMILMQQSRLAQMGEMISMIAHQWRQPLNNLALLNQMITTKYRLGKLDDDIMETFAKNSKKQIALMSSTIDDFRNFFKPDEKRDPFVVNDVIDHILAMTREIFASGNLRIDFDPENVYTSHGYPNALAQVILNIINNAKDAYHETAPKKEKVITIRLYRDDDAIVLEIADRAGGIPEDVLPRIFDPYFSTKPEKNGTGIGLYMSKMLVEKQMNGRITAENYDGGARFIIRLPLYDPDHSTSETGASESS